MKCINVKENLDALLDGEVEVLQKREIENHLETCVSCQAEFENLQAISGILKRNSIISAPPFLDEKVFSQFDEFHAAKPKEKPQKEKIGWFAIPHFAFAAAFLLFALGIVSAFQIGKMSASEISVVMPEIQESKNSVASSNSDFAENKESKAETTKIIEVPTIKEKIVKVPVIKEKIVTRIVYKEKDKAIGKENNFSSNIPNKKNIAQAEIDKYRIVSELKPRIIKTGDNNEK